MGSKKWKRSRADIVFRRDALDAIGGFDRSFSTVAALDEVVRQLRRQGGRAVRMLECRAEGTAVVGGESERLAADREREAIEALDRGDQLRGEGQREQLWMPTVLR